VFVRPLIAALAVLLTLGLCGAGAALGDGPVGRDPAANVPLDPFPAACDLQPTGEECIAAAVADLDQARVDLGLGPYRLPADFASLPGAEQALVLTDLDRLTYGLAPVAGLTSALDADAAHGVRDDTDPASSDTSFGYWTANWAGGYPNIVMAYDAWMYDDGPGSANLDCTAADPKGCWGHRHDILWQFNGTGPLAMGAAAGLNPSGTPGYAMLLGEGDDTYRPSYTFTWSQAVAAGADSGSRRRAHRHPPGAGEPHSLISPGAQAPVFSATRAEGRPARRR
jgi:hypothetical protein